MKVLIIVGATWVIQDAIASIGYYWGKENGWNQALRWARLGIGVMILIGGLINE